MQRKKFLFLVLNLLICFFFLNLVGCTIIFQKGRKSDVEKIQALDIELGRATDGDFLLHHNVGSPANGNDYGPLETPLGRKAAKRLGGAGGRPGGARPPGEGGRIPAYSAEC